VCRSVNASTALERRDDRVIELIRPPLSGDVAVQRMIRAPRISMSAVRQ